MLPKIWGEANERACCLLWGCRLDVFCIILYFLPTGSCSTRSFRTVDRLKRIFRNPTSSVANNILSFAIQIVAPRSTSQDSFAIRIDWTQWLEWHDVTRCSTTLLLLRRALLGNHAEERSVSYPGRIPCQLPRLIQQGMCGVLQKPFSTSSWDRFANDYFPNSPQQPISLSIASCFEIE